MRISGIQIFKKLLDGVSAVQNYTALDLKQDLQAILTHGKLGGFLHGFYRRYGAFQISRDLLGCGLNKRYAAYSVRTDDGSSIKHFQYSLGIVRQCMR